MKWTHLRPLQIQAIHALVRGSDHLLISASTASGKTEAAFLPVISMIAAEATGGVRALYVGPLKALINDQFGRIADLCAHVDVPVHHWHGDVSASDKKKLVERPGGVLLITPESLESLFVNRATFLQALFAGLRFVVVDEVHSFLGTERGSHLRSLLCRLRLVQQSAESQRLIGLSATIGEQSVAQRYLCLPNDTRAVGVIDDKSSKELRLQLRGYRQVAPSEDSEGGGTFAAMAMDVVNHCQGNANLVFANKREWVEILADRAIQIGRKMGLNDRFLVHHGSLAAEVREDAEEVMKSGEVATTFCSSTLEMGIDIGSVRMIGQVGAPWSVASLKQRLGRSGRGDGEARRLRMYLECHEPDPKSDLFDRLHLNLIQAAAVTELMLNEWLEAPSTPKCDLSTLTQQIMSVICQTGGVKADHLHEVLCTHGAFGETDKRLFAMLLRQLARRDVIEQMPGGNLILGLKGEQLRQQRGFYAVFKTRLEFAVLHEGRRLGTVSEAPQPDEHLLLAGRRWQVSQVDQERLTIYVRPAEGLRGARFKGGLGEIDPKIRVKMRELLSDSQTLHYLDSEAAKLLEDARGAATSANICRPELVSLGPSRCAWMTWTGTRIQATLQAMLTTDELRPTDRDIALCFDVGIDRVRSLIRETASRNLSPLEIARRMGVLPRRKYDWLLSDELFFEETAREWIDLPGAIAKLNAV
jgi:ATP-dependent Lhr-like helicase